MVTAERDNHKTDPSSNCLRLRARKAMTGTYDLETTVRDIGEWRFDEVSVSG